MWTLPKRSWSLYQSPSVPVPHRYSSLSWWLKGGKEKKESHLIASSMRNRTSETKKRPTRRWSTSHSFESPCWKWAVTPWAIESKSRERLFHRHGYDNQKTKKRRPGKIKEETRIGKKTCATKLKGGLGIKFFLSDFLFEFLLLVSWSCCFCLGLVEFLVVFFSISLSLSPRSLDVSRARSWTAFGPIILHFWFGLPSIAQTLDDRTRNDARSRAWNASSLRVKLSSNPGN